MSCRLKINHLQSDLTFIFVIICLMFPMNDARGEAGSTKKVVLSYQDTQIIVGASAQILLKQNTSTTLLNYCATKFSHLSKSAHSASQEWQDRHAKIITKANAINHYIARTIEIHDSSFAAEKFQLKIDAQVYDSAQKILNEIIIKNRKQQHYLCNRLILSTAMGEWDMVKVIPQHVQRVEQFKLN